MALGLGGLGGEDFDFRAEGFEFFCFNHLFTQGLGFKV